VNYDPNNKGVLFKNDVGNNPKRPAYRGSAVINNIDLNISAWVRKSQKTGDSFMSLVFEPKERKAGPQRVQPVAPKVEPELDDDLPF